MYSISLDSVCGLCVVVWVSNGRRVCFVLWVALKKAVVCVSAVQ
jgi:hypothetical protein